MKTKNRLVVSMLCIDGHGSFKLQINNNIYEGKLPSKGMWDDTLSKIKNKGRLIAKIKKHTDLIKTKLQIYNLEEFLNNDKIPG